MQGSDQFEIESPSNHLVDNLQCNESIAPRFDSFSQFTHQFVDDTL
jgi:hypothetical protein